MAKPKVANWVAENTTTIGTGDIALSGALEGFARFSVIGDGDVYYTLQNGMNKECGIGTLSGTILKRKEVLASFIDGVYSNPGQLIDLNGYSEIYCTINATIFSDIIEKIDKINSIEFGAEKNPIRPTAEEINHPSINELRSWSLTDLLAFVNLHGGKSLAEILSSAAGAGKIGTSSGLTVQKAIDSLKEGAAYKSIEELRTATSKENNKIAWIANGRFSGIFYSDIGDTDTADNGGTLIRGNNVLWKRIYNGHVTPEMWEAGKEGDDTDKFKSMFAFANSSQTPVEGSGKYILSATREGIVVGVNANLSMATVTCTTNEGFPAGEVYNTRNVIFKMDQESQPVTFSSPDNLAKGNIVIPELIGLKGYIQMDSDDLYVNRNDAVGQATNNPVLKCETNIVDKSGSLNWPIYMGFNTLNNLRVAYKPEVNRITFNAPSFVTSGAQFRALVNVCRNNCTINMDGLLTMGQVYAPIHIERCAHTIINHQHNMARLEASSYYLNYFILVERHANLHVNGSHQQAGVGGIDGNFSRGTYLNGGFYQSIGGHSAISDFTAQGVSYRHHAHMNGWGYFKMLDCNHLQDESGYRESIEVRPDYGSSFDGQIIIRNLRVYISDKPKEYKLINCARVKHDLGVVVQDPEITVDGLHLHAVRHSGDANFVFNLIDLNVGGKASDVTPRLNMKKLAKRYSIKNVTVECNVPIVIRPIVQESDYSALTAEDMYIISNGNKPVRLDVDNIKTTSEWYKYGRSGTDISAAWISSWKFGANRVRQEFHISNCEYLTVLHRTPYDVGIYYDRCKLPGTIAVSDWFEEPTQDVKSTEIIVRDSIVISPTVGRNGDICACPVDYINCQMAHNSDYNGVLPETNLYIGGAVRNQVRQYQGCVIRNPKNQFELVDFQFQKNVESNYVNPKYFTNKQSIAKGIGQLTIPEIRSLGNNDRLSIAVQPKVDGSFAPLNSVPVGNPVTSRNTTVFKSIVKHGLGLRPSFVIAAPHAMGRCWVEGSATDTEFTVVGDIKDSYFAWIAII